MVEAVSDSTPVGGPDERAIVLVVKATADEATDLTVQILDLLPSDGTASVYGWPATEVFLMPCPVSGAPPKETP